MQPRRPLIKLPRDNSPLSFSALHWEWENGRQQFGDVQPPPFDHQCFRPKRRWAAGLAFRFARTGRSGCGFDLNKGTSNILVSKAELTPAPHSRRENRVDTNVRPPPGNQTPRGRNASGRQMGRPILAGLHWWLTPACGISSHRAQTGAPGQPLILLAQHIVPNNHHLPVLKPRRVPGSGSALLTKSNLESPHKRATATDIADHAL